MEKGLPHIGARILKSAVAVAICLLLSQFSGGEGMRIYSSIGALWCIRPYKTDTKKMAIQRIIGTAIGSAYGALTFFIEIVVFGIQGTWYGYVLESVFILAVLYTTVLLNVKNASYFSCVVYLSIVVAHITDASPWLFVRQRIFETLLGIFVGISVNMLDFPRRKKKNTLVVSGVDDILLDAKGQLSPYVKVALNRMIDDGAQFSLVTMRTPASVRESMDGVKLKLPIVVMDGAALYDMKNKKYIKACIIPKQIVLDCCALLEKCDIHYFLNGLLNDILIIYYGKLENEAEKSIYDKMHTSPYRNYISSEYYSDGQILYIMAIDKTEKLQPAVDTLVKSGLSRSIKYRFYPSTDYPGYSYLKIYEKGASRQNMLKELHAISGADEMITFGSVQGLYNVVLEGQPPESAVRTIANLYEPYFWQAER